MAQIIKRAFYLYINSFREMTLGRAVWLIILIKLFILFALLRLIFFSSCVSENSEKVKQADYVVLEKSQN